MKLTYGYLEGRPTVYVEDSGGVAFWYYDDSWKAATGTDGADIFTKSAVLSKAQFDKMFPHLPPIPFQAEDI
jgi:hypothetical protein